MSHQLVSLLDQWHGLKDQCQWVLGTIIKTIGPCYRKAGAMMLFGGQGQQIGMLSGGCLESDIQRHAAKVMATGQTATISYDGNDEDDMSFMLGIGCGGTVYIQLQLVEQANHYLQLPQVRERLKQRQYGDYFVAITRADIVHPGGINNVNSIDSTNSTIGGVDNKGHNHIEVSPQRPNQRRRQDLDPLIKNDCHYLAIPLTPPPHLLVVGGGLDARPLVKLAFEMGWTVSLWDPRPANGRGAFFPTVDHIVNCPVAALPQYCQEMVVDGLILMSHNISLDAAALQYLAPALTNGTIAHGALLGPHHRRLQVLSQAGLASDSLDHCLSGPAGLPIGGELPESIALSILAECHGKFYQGG